MDQFFQNGGIANKETLNNLGLSCLILAAKMAELDRKVPNINPNVFNIEELKIMQNKVCQTLSYQMNQYTYITVVN